MRPKRLSFTPSNANLTGFLSNATGATWTLTNTATTDGYAHQVSIKNDSATDHSGKTAILTGTDANDNSITETVTLPAGSATVESSKYFKTLLTVVPSATIGADTMDIGWVDEFVSQCVPLNRRNKGRGVGIRVDVTGTINYTIQNTFDDVSLDYTNVEYTWLDHDTTELVSQTASKNGNYDKVPTGSRLKVNSYSSGATIKVTWIHNE